MANIILKDVNKIYPNNVHAVYDFNLEIKDKEFIVFVGPSGCGKSTTLRMIAGLEEISTGEFYVDGKLMNYVQPKDRNVAMVFQNYALYPHMSVFRNMSYGLTIKKEYLPLYEKSEEIDNLLSNIKEYKKEINKVERIMSKNADDNESKARYDELYNLIMEALKKIMEIRKPIIGRDTKRAERLEKEIDTLEREKDYVTNLLGVEDKENTNDEELINMYKNDIKNIDRVLEEKHVELASIKGKDSEILKYRHYYDYEIDYEVYRAGSVLDLSKYMSRKPSALSGGQRQRVALGRAIVRKPKVFLMDEPLSNLDAKLRVQTRGEISRLHKRVGATTIYVTHDQTEAMTLADRIVIMKDGYIQQIAEPMVAFNDPNNMFVAGFIGSPAMNFVKGSFDGKKFVSDSGLISVDLNKEDVALLTKNNASSVVLGIRPENIQLSDKSGITLDVDSVELLGNEFIIYSRFEDKLLAVKTNNPVDPDLVGPHNFAFDNKKLYFFDPESTNRIR